MSWDDFSLLVLASAQYDKPIEVPDGMLVVGSKIIFDLERWKE